MNHTNANKFQENIDNEWLGSNQVALGKSSNRFVSGSCKVIGFLFVTAFALAIGVLKLFFAFAGAGASNVDVEHPLGKEDPNSSFDPVQTEMNPANINYKPKYFSDS